MSLLALIPARGGSKGIPRKNIIPFCGKPLLQWSIDVALQAKGVDRLVVSTDDPEIAELALAGGADVPLIRTPELATDTASGMMPVFHALQLMPEVSEVLLLQPTSPLRQVQDVEAIIEMHRKDGRDAVVSVTLSNKHPSQLYSISPAQVLDPFVPSTGATCRQQIPHAYALNGALYVASRSFLERERSFVAPSTTGYVMPPERSLDIDSPLDWEWGEFLMHRQK